MEDPIRELIAVGKLFESRQWFLGTSGNLSFLDSHSPLVFSITGSGLDKGRLGKESFVRVAVDEKMTRKAKRHPSHEHPIHRAIYQSTDAGCVIHAHILSGLLAADMLPSNGAISLSGLEILKGLGCKTAGDILKVPVIDNNDDVQDLADNLAQAVQLTNGLLAPAVLVRHHGMFSWGGSVFAAKRHMELLSHAFDYLTSKSHSA